MQYPRLVESKTAAHEVTTVGLNPGMDLLATVFESSALTCSRLLFLQKVWHKADCGRINSITWRPDGRILAIGASNNKTEQNICTLHDVEDGKEIYSILCDEEITSIAWFKCSSIGDQDRQEDPLKLKKTLPPPDTKAENFSHQLALKQDQLNILMIATSEGVINLYALGLFHLGSIDICKELNSQIINTHMSTCMRYITSIMSTHSSPNNSFSTMKVVKLDTLQSRSKEILNVAKMYAKVTDELEYLEDTLLAITTSWTDVLAGLDNKLSSYCSRKTKKPEDSLMGSYTFVSADDLLQLLVLGIPSDNLEKFLADMSDKGLRKLNQAIEQTCLRIQNLIVKNAQKCCYHLHSDLNLLRGMSLWRERYSDVGLDDKSVVDAMRDVGSLVLKLTELQQVIDHSLKSTKSFFKWLISVSCRMSGEHGSSLSGDVNKTTQQDIQLITDFILENFDYNSNQDELGSLISMRDDDSFTDSKSWSNRPTCSNFTLEQVGQYLKNEPLTRLKYSFAKPESNFWIDFFKDRPDICEPKILNEDKSSVLIFYPHRPETSLIQEHRRTCSSIKAAFKLVASNIKLSSSDSASSNLLNLKDFIKNGPTQRIRVETNIKLMQHYTIFQTKSSPVTKQFLVSQALIEKYFKLISIEFQTLNPVNSSTRQTTCTRLSSGPSISIAISDSCFFENRSTKKLHITFLLIDQTNSDTIIVQLDVEKLFESCNCPSRPQKDLSKIFRTNDTIEKYCTQLVLKLDLHTDPACNRKHEPEMMVKRIKGLMGLEMYASGSRGVIAFTSANNRRLHLYELESVALGPDIVDDEVEDEDNVDESLIDTGLLE